MSIYIVRLVPDQVTAEDLIRQYGWLGKIERVTIKPPPSNPSGRVAVITMAEVRGRRPGAPRSSRREPGERHLRLVKPTPREERKREEGHLLPEEKRPGRIRRALECLLGFVRQWAPPQMMRGG